MAGPGAGGRGVGGDAEAVLAVAHRVAVAVPIADHDRQAGGHRFQRGDAEGFLDVVGDGDEQVGGGPAGAVAGEVLAVDEYRSHAGAVAGGSVGICLGRLRIGGLAGKGKDDLVPCGPGRGFEALEHLEGVCLGVKHEPAGREGHDLVVRDPELPTRRDALTRTEVEIRDMHPQRDHRQLRTLWAHRGPHAPRQVFLARNDRALQDRDGRP
ncbi:hypothetical protein LRS10_03770 [Phenylobacterium sp. J426]|nr:hypothetical protein [Phenylobacterium sp. J426]MCR5873388.1 hypothetical protein [Phenylobacterium sp. J426]